MRNTVILALALFLLLLANTSRALDVSAIEQAAGLKGTWFEAERVYKLSVPRDDVKVVVDGSTLPPFMG
jgi:hypothetical protein